MTPTTGDGPWPARIEMSGHTVTYLREVYPPADPHPAPGIHLWVIPIVIDDTMPAGAWRALDAAGAVIRQHPGG